MSERPLSCVLLADRHHGLTGGVRGAPTVVAAHVVERLLRHAEQTKEKETIDECRAIPS